MCPWPVIGHEWALDLLTQAIRSGRLRHAYLFTGPAQVGKTTVALAFARALVCERATGEPCVEGDASQGGTGPCRVCRRMAEGHYPDVQVIGAERGSLQIDQVRALQTEAALSPLEGPYRVFIIPEIERATLPAANALLKILEEPPPQVILLLTAARRDQVLPTILSRCQVVGLRPLPLEQVTGALQARWGVAPEHAELLARLSGGRIGWAISAHTDADLWAQRAQYLDDLLDLTSAGYFARLAYAEKMARSSDEVEIALGLWATWWRDVLLVQRGVQEAVVNLDRRVQLDQQAVLYDPAQVEAALVDLMQTLRRLRANVNLRLALDVLLLRLPRPAAL